MVKKKTLIKLALFTLFGFSLIGLIIIRSFSVTPINQVLLSGEPLWIQIIIGTSIGLVAAVIGWKIIEQPPLQPVRIFFSTLIQNLNLSFSEIILISFCAGVGEEILFRGAIQPFLGIWITAIVFVAIHGYLNPYNWRLSVYGIFMTLVIAGLGYSAEHYGLISAISAHIMIDIYLLDKLTHDKATRESLKEEANI